MTTVGDGDTLFVARGEVVMTINGLMHGATWGKRVKRDEEYDGWILALRDAANELGVSYEFDGPDSHMGSTTMEEIATVNSLENDNVSRESINKVLSELHTRYVEESAAASKVGDRQMKRIAIGKRNGIVALALNLKPRLQPRG